MPAPLVTHLCTNRAQCKATSLMWSMPLALGTTKNMWENEEHFYMGETSFPLPDRQHQITKENCSNKKSQTWDYLNELNDSRWNAGLTEASEILYDVVSLQADRHGCVQRVRSELVLVNVFRTTDRLLQYTETQLNHTHTGLLDHTHKCQLDHTYWSLRPHTQLELDHTHWSVRPQTLVYWSLSGWTLINGLPVDHKFGLQGAMQMIYYYDYY